ncbi:MAG TPA: M20/M25/M40 family metallo-hydrolase [Thermoanaerobaculia bacterium]|nr:M20/M25/M40 family metallo-hydrolase [Thermoanaerobaculia bacterium]
MTDAELARKKRRHRNERIAAAIVVAVAIAATIGAYFWNERTKEELRRDQTYIPKKPVITPEVLLLQEYVRIDTSTPAGAATGARWLAALLEKNGIHAELIESAPQRLNVYARIAGKNKGHGLLLFNHIDVVPPNGTWRQPPFGGTFVADAMYGRGTLDMKGIAITQLLAFVEIAKSGTKPEHDLVFLATADEETGSEFGMQWLLAHRPDVFDQLEYGITEGGVTEIVRERMTYFGIEVGGKQLVKITMTAPDRETLRRFRIALEPHMFPRTPLRILPAVRDYFRSAAPTRIAYRADLEDIDRSVREGTFWRLPAAYRELTHNTIWASDTFQRDGEWLIDLHLRNLPDENPDARIAWLQELAASKGVQVKRVWSKEGPAPVSSSNTPLFALLAREATRRYQTPAGPLLGYRSSSDSRFLRPRGITCYGVSPYPVELGQSVSIHGVNERISIVHFADGVDFMKNVVQDWAERD